MKVVWTDFASENLDEIFEFYAKRSPTLGQKIVSRLVLKADFLGNFPLMGRMVIKRNNPAFREIFDQTYRIVYYVRENRIDILTVTQSTKEFE